jgi:hypothetical protein
MPADEHDDYGDLLPEFEDMACCDWKADPENVLEQIDSQLRDHGLEVVIYDEDSDTYLWTIVRRAP